VQEQRRDERCAADGVAAADDDAVGGTGTQRLDGAGQICRAACGQADGLVALRGVGPG
jgi:hypothetical protein